MIPVKKVNSESLMIAWENSKAYYSIYGFVETVNSSIAGKSNSNAVDISESINNLVDMLKHLNCKVNDFPPDNEPQRFGNKAFVKYYNWLKENLLSVMNQFIFKNVKDEQNCGKIEECGTYLLEGIGHPQRIDYGSGHELSFIAFIITLFDVKFLDPTNNSKADLKNVALVVMPHYLDYVRNLQKTYNFEPAGSRGVHALDDFQFIPFIWGSSQLIGQKNCCPEQIPLPDIAANKKDDNLFFSCIDFIFKMKSGPFSEHSNTLYNISSVESWKKLNYGMLKMFKGEVLSKYVIVQHFLFGTIFSLDPVEKEFRVPRMEDTLPTKCC